MKPINTLASSRPSPTWCLISCSIKCLAMFPIVMQAEAYGTSYGGSTPID